MNPSLVYKVSEHPGVTCFHPRPFCSLHNFTRTGTAALRRLRSAIEAAGVTRFSPEKL